MNRLLLLLAMLLLGTPLSAHEPDRMASFQGMASPQESLARFREWFRTAYAKELRLYKKRIGNPEPECKDAIVQFYIDTLGRPHFLGSNPDGLSDSQIEILKTTFNRSPSWTPAVQKGRKVQIKYVLPIQHGH